MTRIKYLAGLRQGQRNYRQKELLFLGHFRLPPTVYCAVTTKTTVVSYLNPCPFADTALDYFAVAQTSLLMALSFQITFLRPNFLILYPIILSVMPSMRAALAITHLFSSSALTISPRSISATLSFSDFIAYLRT